MKRWRSLVLVAALCLAALAGCTGEAERLQVESLEHLENAAQILQRNVGNADAAIAELDQYLRDHRERMLEVRSAGAELVRRMGVEDRERFGRRALDRARPVRERIDTLVRQFPDAGRLVRKLQEFL